MVHHPSKIPPSLHYATRILRRRPAAMASGALLLFCLLSLVALSLLFAESTYLTTLAEADTGKHYGVLYRLDNREYRILQSRMDQLEADFTTVPVYGWLEDIESEEALLGITVPTEALRDWYALTWSGTLSEGEILLPPSLPQREPYYRGSHTRSFFFHAESVHGKKTGEPITRELTILDTVESCDRALPYAFVTAETAEDILSTTSGEILYDVYFTTPVASDYAVALVVDALLSDLGWDTMVSDNDKIREATRQSTGDPQWPSHRQVRYDSDHRQIRYIEFIHYELLSLLNREYMDDPLFFFLILPVILASAFSLAGFLREDTETHMREYGLLWSNGTGKRTLYGIVYAQALLILLLSLPPVLLGTLGIASLYDNATGALFQAQGLPYAFPMPWGNLMTVCLYVLLATCLLIWRHTRRLLRHPPVTLLSGTVPGELAQVYGAGVLDANDPVGQMAKLRFRRERRQRLWQVLPMTLVLGVCGYMLYTLLTNRAHGFSLAGIVYLVGAYALLTIRRAWGEVRQHGREYAILRQCGTSDETLWHHIRQTRRQVTFLGMGVTAAIFGGLYMLPILLGGWVMADTPVIRFLTSAAYLVGVPVSGGIALILQLGDLVFGQLAMVRPVQKMLERGIVAALKKAV